MIPLFKPYMPAKLPDLDRIIQSGQLAYGKYAREFEARLAEYIGIDEVLCTSSFNSAYLVLIRTLGLGHGDEVVASPMCCLASSQPFAVNGIKLIWADIDPSTGTLDPEAVKSKITPRTRAIVHNHFCGYAGHVGEMRKIADEHGLMLVRNITDARPVIGMRTLRCTLSKRYACPMRSTEGLYLSRTQRILKKPHCCATMGSTGRDSATILAKYPLFAIFPRPPMVVYRPM